MDQKKADIVLPKKPGINMLKTGNIVDNLKKSKVIDLDSSVETVLNAASLNDELAEVAGYVLAWDKYVLVVGIDSKEEIIR